MLARGLRFLYHPKNWVDKKPGSHTPPTRPAWHAFTAYLNISRRIIMCPTHDRRLACEVEMNSTSHASRRLSAKQQKVLKTRHKIISGIKYQMVASVFSPMSGVIYQRVILRTEGSSHTNSIKRVRLLNLNRQMLCLCGLWIHNKRSYILNANLEL